MSRKKKDLKRARKAAARLPAHMQDIAFSKWKKSPPDLGKFGPASEVRHVDPEEVDVARYLNPKE